MSGADTTFLFWNLHGNAVDEHLFRLIDHQRVDVVLLAESAYAEPAVEAALLSLLNRRLPGSSESFHAPQRPQAAKVQVLSRLRSPMWDVAFWHDRYTGWTLTTDAGVRLLMVGAHFPSAQYEDGDGQRKTAIELRLDIEAYERQWREENPGIAEPPGVLVIGDLNASPFDAGIVGFYGLNASGNREVVLRQGQRTLGGRSVRFLYNPMWRFLGDRATPGTFYRRLSSPVCFDWFVLDQVLMTPVLVPHFAEDSLRILTWDADQRLGGEPLTKDSDGTPRPEVSDHLPILFTLRL